MKKPSQERASTERHYVITEADLPLSCPLPSMRLWDAHPRIYIPLENGKGSCYYCGASFELQAETPEGHHIND